MKHILIPALILTLLLSACGAQAVPTIDPAQVQASAVSAANTMIALTQAAIPPTPVPTDTPEPSPTLPPPPTSQDLPTLPALASPTASGSSGGGDPCNVPLGANVPGTKTIIQIKNSSSAQANVSIYLNKTKFGQCGYRGYPIAKGDSVTITDLTYGCYNVTAWINDPQKPKTNYGYGCINSPLKWVFTVTNSNITLAPP